LLILYQGAQLYYVSVDDSAHNTVVRITIHMPPRVFKYYNATLFCVYFSFVDFMSIYSITNKRLQRNN